MYPQSKHKIFFRSNLLLKGKMIANNLEAAQTCDHFVQQLGMWFPRKIIVSTEIFFKTGKFPSSFVRITYCSFIIQISMKDHCLVPTMHPNNGRKTLQFLCFRIDKDLIQFMANREGRFKKIRPRSTPNSNAHKHERCYQSKPHIYHPVLVCLFSQS